MAYLTIARISGDAEQLLDDYQGASDVMSGVGRDNGLIAHVAAKTGDGLLIVNLWQSKEGSEAAAQDSRRGDVLQRGGIDPDQIRQEHHEVANYEIVD